jgi:TPR repeat protein
MRRVIMVLLMVLCPLLASAQDAASLRAGVVKIKSTLNNKSRTGSGFVVAVDGGTTYIVTAAHVIEGDPNPKVEFFARQSAPVNAEIVKQELRVDLAVLKVESAPQSTALAFETAAKPKVGDEVVAFGFPQGGGSWLMSKADLAGREGPDLIVSGAAIDQGSSGGPLIKDGKVIGVVQALQGKFVRAAPASLVVETLEGWGIALKPQATDAAVTRTGDERKSTSASAAPASIDYGNFNQVKQAAEGGDSKAQFALAEMYLDAKGVAQNSAEAAKWYRRAADAGYATAQGAMGLMSLTKAVGLARDDESAVAFCCDESKSKKDERLAMVFSAIEKLQVKDTAALREATQWLQKGAQQGDASAQLLYGYMALGGIGMEKNLAEGVKWMRLAATEDPTAQTLMGTLYLHGAGVEKNVNEGVRRLKEAAERGVPQAMTTLGAVYQSGNGVVQDYAEAARWLRKAVEHNDPKAKAMLGLQYLQGFGVARDEAQGFALIRQAAEAGDATGQFGLAMAFISGKGIAPNRDEAIKWLQAAARQGITEAQQMLEKEGLRW